MNQEITLRSATDNDINAINAVTIAAFQTLEISNHTDQDIERITIRDFGPAHLAKSLSCISNMAKLR